MNVKRTIPQLLLLGSLAAVVSVAHGASRSDDPVAASAAAAAAPAPPITAAAAQGRARARAQLHVLRSPRNLSRDAVPTQVLHGQLLADGSVDIADARRVSGADGESAWIAPSADGKSVCGVRAGAVACPPVALLEVTGLSPGINGRAGDDFHVWGIAGDDVSSILLEQSDGRRTSVSVTDNFFDVETRAWPRGLTWTGPEGAESFTFPAYSG